MGYKYNTLTSLRNADSWTDTAKDCYNLGCVCNKCEVYKIYFINKTYKCMMKNTVIELVRRYGTPNNNE